MAQCECSSNKIILNAMEDVQDLCKGIEADAKSDGPSKHKYLSLVGVYNAVKPALKEKGLRVRHMQCTEPVTGKQIQKTILRHRESGQEYVDTRYLVPDKPGSQGAGSAETYMKRYAILSMLGIATGENDDDGEIGRAYLERVKKFGDYIKTLDKPREVFAALVEKFKIKNIDELGDHGLFDALLFIVKGQK